MAERDLNSGVGIWNNKKPFPKDNYICRCIEEKFAPSGKGNPMVTRQWEIVSPEVVTVGDGQLSVVGVKFFQYLMTQVLENGQVDKDKSDKSFAKLAEDYKALGYDKTSIDDQNPPLIAKGKCAYIILWAKEDKQTKPLTNAERLAGKKVGEDIVDPATGKPLIKYVLNVDQVLGIAPAPTF